MSTTKIEWADAVWNPTTGCTPVSEGCENCYARRFAYRLRGRCGYPADDPFRVTLHPERLEEPLKWKKPRRVFVNSMGDLFHEDVPTAFIAEIFDVMAGAGQHTFLILTKRPERMKHLLVYGDSMKCDSPEHHRLLCAMPLRNVWLGVTAENQQAADERIPTLLQTPAAVRFISAEPLLGPVDLELYLPYHNHPLKDEWHRNGYHIRRLNIGITEGTLDWIICGGETGPNARPMHPDWVRSLRDQCKAAGMPFWFKSWGEWSHLSQEREKGWPLARQVHEWPDGTFSMRVGKKYAGRLLDGRAWDELPEVEMA